MVETTTDACCQPTPSEPNMEAPGGGCQLAPKLLNWATLLDPQTRKQAELAATLPFIHPHIALMPDAHLGSGATVGSVIPTKGAIVPAAVGVDIGCGMMAVRTQFTLKDIEGKDRKALRENIERAVPLSAGHYNRKVQKTAEPRVAELEKLAADAGVNPDAIAPPGPKDWRLQLGTLGSGNHFIEVTLDEQDRVWLFLHSGSRGVGNKMAVHHIGVAQRLNKEAGIVLPKKMHHGNEVEERDLAYLTEGTQEFDAYLADLRWAQRFAYLNREEMMERVVNQFQRWMSPDPMNPTVKVEPQQVINCHHNYTEQETHFGETVWLSRKGAIDAHEGVWGLVPGSMGTRSYVVQGKGNLDSLCSSPHGAGRPRGRKQSVKILNIDDFKATMKAAGVEWNEAKAETFLDESPAAYKDIDRVMDDAKDLVVIVHELRQIINVKGD